MTRRQPSPFRTLVEGLADELDAKVRALTDPVDQVDRAILRQATSVLLWLVQRFADAHPGVPLERVPVTELVRWAKEERRQAR